MNDPQNGSNCGLAHVLFSKRIFQGFTLRSIHTPYRGLCMVRRSRKRNRDPKGKLKGNGLDFFLRSVNDGQTLGVSIGPDISLLTAEILLSAVDGMLVKAINPAGFRYIDDYELGFLTRGEAENAKAVLQSILATFELALNPSEDRRTPG